MGCQLVVLALSAGPVLGAGSALPDETRAGLRRATTYARSIATEGGYLWSYSVDLKERWGEGKATASQIWVQPPGTPSMGMAFLRCYEVTGEPLHLQAAQAAASALARGQLESGGWDYLVEFDPQESQRWLRRADRDRLSAADQARRRNVTTFDDDNTQSALRFLMAFVQASGLAENAQVGEVRAALDYGLAKMLEAQYPTGAWPQRYDGKPRDLASYPVRPAAIPGQYPREHPRQNYTGYYTLNDHTQSDCIRTMLEAFRRFGKSGFRDAAKKGGDFLVLAQLPAPQSAWAQQYNPDMEPAWARAFEPPAVCSAESVGVIRILITLYLETGDDKYLGPLPAAFEWFRRSQLGPNQWARFYELGSNRPIYGDRDGKIHYQLEEISEERRRGYSWLGSYDIPETLAEFEEVRRLGRQAARAKRTGPGPAGPDRRAVLERQARAVLATLDEQGRWIERDRVETRVFIRHLNVLCDYLEALGKP